MAAQKKLGRDWVYLVMHALQMFGMLVLDLVTFYPPALWQPPSAPLHILSTLREAYVRRTGDPFFSGAHGHPPWLQAFLAVEGLVQLPLVACFVYDTASSPRRSSSPRAEVVGVALGALNFMGSAVCCWELHCAPPGVLSAAQKIPLLYGQYLPFAVIPGLMAVDMGGRLLARIQDAEEKEKKQ